MYRTSFYDASSLKISHHLGLCGLRMMWLRKHEELKIAFWSGLWPGARPFTTWISVSSSCTRDDITWSLKTLLALILHFSILYKVWHQEAVLQLSPQDASKLLIIASEFRKAMMYCNCSILLSNEKNFKTPGLV